MVKRPGLMLALATVALLAAALPAVPAGEPEPAATLAPLDLSAPADDHPEPAAAGSEKVLGHIYATAFCSLFVQHYNAAATAMIENDRRLDAVDTQLQQIADDYKRRDGALRIVEHRNQLIATVGQMLQSIPGEQHAVDELLKQIKEAKDEERREELQESASQLQQSVDRQRAVAYDASNIVHVLIDRHTKEDMVETQIQSTLPAGSPPVRITALDDPVQEPGAANPLTQIFQEKPVRAQTVLQWDRQRSIIAKSESKAQTAAVKVVRICTQRPYDKPLPPK